ncbi:anti-sigma factor [Microbispora sp. NBC_01189]|uniref:anti-sigma factor n=1 Tax=Microbispora sp. NBC_01189 TaxID=2903583 RepID=UPI002E0FC57B|nr:anti-sigma factor [Microbispora sp. NBC_01189]
MRRESFHGPWSAGPADPHTLAGAYALDAIDDDRERRRFEDHLARCGDCALEVATLIETAARLGRASAAPTPSALRERVMAQIGQVRQLPPPVSGRGRAGSRGRGWAGRRADSWADSWAGRWTGTGWRLRWALVAGLTGLTGMVAACVLGVAVLGAQDEAERAQRAYRQVTSVLAAPDARTATATTAGGARGTVVVSRSRAAVLFLAAGLAPLPRGRVYQVWRIGPDRVESAGLLSVDARGDAVPVPAATGAGVSQLSVSQVGVTVEPAGGSRQPTGRPLLVVDIPAA